MTEPLHKRFRIAFSFTGKKREFVERVAEVLGRCLGREKILYDRFHEAEFAGVDLAFELPEHYKEAELVVAVLCPDYESNEWCGLEWRAIYSMVKAGGADKKRVMLSRYALVDGEGLHGLSGFVDLDAKMPHEFAELILERLAINEGGASYKDHYTKLYTEHLVPPGSAGAASPAPAELRTSIPHNLPALQPFFGREEEVSQIADSLCGDEVRLLTLTGPGGTGKTRLAIEAARQMSAHFSGGTWFVPLAELPDASRFFEAVGKALGLSSGTGGNQEERVIAALQEKADSGPVLLVMDNFEQIVDSAAFPLNTLLNRVRTLSCLVTSRQRLLLEGEREQPVRPLPTPLHPGTPQVLLEFPSVQLFVNRAQAARSDFQLTARNADAITALCTRLEGIPLAIELSAAWSQTLTPAQMLERLNRRFDLLVSKRRDVSPRHSTLRATIEWSFRLLSLDLQSFFAQLSVFRGGWTLEAAETVSQDPFAMGFLAELCERSLIIAEETPNGTMRYRMLESMREFVAERLADSGASDIRRRYIGYFLDFSEAGAAQLTGPLQSEWLNRIEDDHGNLRAILAYFAASDAPDDKETHLRLAGTLWRFWMMRGYLTEGRQHLATALDRAESTPRPSRVLALAAAGNLAGAQGDRVAALRYLETCRDESR
ncbi:MAG: AAA family ATPase, partial [Armatimonadota bacterium]